LTGVLEFHEPTTVEHRLQVIDRLLEIEIENRKKARIDLRFKQSKLEEKSTIDQFDFAHHESRQKQKSRILNLLDLGFIQAKKDIILIGNPGTGKTFFIQVLCVCRHPDRDKNAFYNRHGHDQSAGGS
jgi:DNA replication protein DnaC